MKNEAEAYFRREISTVTGNEAKRIEKKKKKNKGRGFTGKAKDEMYIIQIKILNSCGDMKQNPIRNGG